MKKNFPRHFIIFLLIFATFGISGCGLKKVASKTSAQIFYDASSSIDTEADVDLAEQASLSFLKMLEGFYRQDPKDKLILLLLTRSYAGYAFGFTENQILADKGSDKEAYEKSVVRAKRFYSRARRYGMELLDRYHSFAKSREGTLDQFDAALKSFKKKDLENLFWAGFAWGNYINSHRDSVEAIAEMPRMEALMNRVIELDPSYYYGGAHLFLGAFYGSRPPLLGGDPQRSKAEFEKAIAINDKNLMAPVMMAQYYAVQVQDMKLFENLLSGALAADAAALPEQRLMNELAKIRAKILLDKKSQYFTQATRRKKSG